MKKQSLALLALTSLAVTACANSGAAYRPIVDGPQGAKYEHDLADCQRLAQERAYLNGDTRTAMLAGALIGGAIGALTNNSESEDVFDGMLGGAAAGGLSGAADTHGERREIVLNCMAGRGHNVLG